MTSQGERMTRGCAGPAAGTLSPSLHTPTAQYALKLSHPDCMLRESGATEVFHLLT